MNDLLVDMGNNAVKWCLAQPKGQRLGVAHSMPWGSGASSTTAMARSMAREMAQHHLPVQFVAPAVLTFGRELMVETSKKNDEEIHAGGQRLGTLAESSEGDAANHPGASVRERALAAAEKRAREAKKDDSG